MNNGEVLKVAFIGGGHSATKYEGLVRAGYRVEPRYATRSGRHGVAKDLDGRALPWGTSYDGPELAANVKRMLTEEEPPDIVVQSTPPNVTPDITRVVLDHTPETTALTINKPVGLDADSVDDIADRIRGSGRVVAVNHQWIVNGEPFTFFKGHVLEKINRGDEARRARGRWHGNTFLVVDNDWWRTHGGGPLIEQGHPGHLLGHVLDEHLGEMQVATDRPPQVYYGVHGEVPPGIDMSRVGSGLYVPTEIAADLVTAKTGTPVRLEASGIHPGDEVVDVGVLFKDGTLVTFGKREATLSKNGKVIDGASTAYPWPAFTGEMRRVAAAATGNPDGDLVDYDEAVAALRVARSVMDSAKTSQSRLFEPALLDKPHTMKAVSLTQP